MRTPPVSLSLDVQANVYKDGRLWVAECPAFKLASQGRTKAEAKAMLAEALELSLDIYREQGKFERVVREAMKHPSSRTVAHAERITVPVPIDLLTARHVAKAARAVA